MSGGTAGNHHKCIEHLAKLWSMQPLRSLGARLPQENMAWSVCLGSDIMALAFGAATPNEVTFSNALNGSLDSS
jgi:hypothetical protein